MYTYAVRYKQIMKKTSGLIKNLIMPMLIVSILNGCAFFAYKYNKKTFEQEKKSVILVGMYACQDNREKPLIFSLVKVDENHESFMKRHAYYISAFSPFTIMIDPGIYYITDLFWQDASYSYRSIMPGLSKSGFVVYGAFKISANEVLSIGNLVLNNFTMIENGNIIFNVSRKPYDLDIIKNDLINKGYSELAVKVKEATFYEAGSIIREKNGEFSLQMYKHNDGDLKFH